MIKLLLAAVLAAFLCPFAAHATTPRLVEVPAAGGGVFLRTPNYTDVRVLAANTAETHTVPAGAHFVVFSSNCAAFYVNWSTTATVPGADVTDGSGSELNPTQRYMGTGVTGLSLISPTTCTITMAFYQA